MKKIILIILITMIALGTLVTIIGLFNAIQINASKVEQEYTINEEFSKIDIDVDTDVINVYYTSDKENTIKSTDYKGMTLSTKVIDGTLFIKRKDTRNFFGHLFNFSKYRIDLYLSIEEIESLKIELSTGNITIHEGFAFNLVDIESSTGNINFTSTVKEEMEIEASTGNITFSDCPNLGKVVIENSTGNIIFQNTHCDSLDIETSTGNCKLIKTIIAHNLSIEGSTGNILFDESDAEKINIELSTGNVTGTLLSNKFFIVKTDTGKVSVPETRDGGECRIETSTGNINISYK